MVKLPYELTRSIESAHFDSVVSGDRREGCSTSPRLFSHYVKA